MTNGKPNIPKTGKAKPHCESATPSVELRSIEQLAEWIDLQLDKLISGNPEWQTVQSNRQYFGR